MQVTTNITTTETAQTGDGANFRITIFEQRISAFCDTCPNEASGSEEALKNQGWHLDARQQFCPECN